MRLDDFLSTVGIVKRRTIAKELASNGLIHINGRRAKPSSNINPQDIISIRGSRPRSVEVLTIPAGASVPKEQRDSYIRELPTTG